MIAGIKLEATIGVKSSNQSLIMKTLKSFFAVFFSLLAFNSYSQTKPDSLGLPGDNFDLYGALELFKKAATPEEFEKSINSNDNSVNNLDLDGDGKVDYVKVIDKKEGNGHTLVLQVAVSPTETQDVAVIEIDKPATDNAHVQIVGDEELYGKNYIVEPKDETAAKPSTAGSPPPASSNTDDVYSTTDNANRTNSNSSTNTNNNQPPSDNSYYNSNPTVVVNVWAWPSVQYIYGPSYGPWSSPWYWNNYPMWWQPWQPVYWQYHYRRAYFYHYPYYQRVGYYRSPAIHNWYYGKRTSSATVLRNRESGFYAQRQMVYKSNAQPGTKYNNQPAGRNGEMQPHDGGNINNTGNPPRQQRNDGGMKQQNNNVNTAPPTKQFDNPGKQPANNPPVQKQQQPPRQKVFDQPVQQKQPMQQKQPEQRPMQQKPMQQPKQQMQRAPKMEAPRGGGGGGRKR